MPRMFPAIASLRGGLILLVLAVLIFVLFSQNQYLHSLLPQRLVVKEPWNNLQAQRYIIETLKHYGDAAGYGFDTAPDSSRAVQHFVYEYYPLQYENRRNYLVVAYTKPAAFDCESCIPKLSLFEFRQRGDGWSMGAQGIGIIDAGSWGSPPEHIAIQRIGRDLFGIVIEQTDIGNDALAARYTIYASLDGRFRQLFPGPAENSGHAIKSAGIRPWDLKVLTRAEPEAPFYDLVFSRKIAHAAGDDPFEIQTRTYHFDGDKYVQVR